MECDTSCLTVLGYLIKASIFVHKEKGNSSLLNHPSHCIKQDVFTIWLCLHAKTTPYPEYRPTLLCHCNNHPASLFPSPNLLRSPSLTCVAHAHTTSQPLYPSTNHAPYHNMHNTLRYVTLICLGGDGYSHIHRHLRSTLLFEHPFSEVFPPLTRSFQINNELSWWNPGSQWQGSSFLLCLHFWGILLAGVLPNTCRGVMYWSWVLWN